MKELLSILILFVTIHLASQDALNDVEFKLSYNGQTPMTAASRVNDFIYKGFDNSQLYSVMSNYTYFEPSLGNYLFTENCETSNTNCISIDFSIIGQEIFTEKFSRNTGLEKITDNSFNEHIEEGFKLSYPLTTDKKVTEFFFQLETRNFLRAVVISKNETINFDLFNKNLLVGFQRLLNANKKNPSKFLKVLDYFFPMDYMTQIDFIESFETDVYSTNSIYGSALFDLHTNNGSFVKVKNRVVRRIKLEIDSTKLRALDEYINDVGPRYDIVMFNEFHSYPHTRFSFMHTLDQLKDLGYDYLALETLPAKQPNAPLVTPKDEISGYYVNEQACSLMIHYAASIGFKLVAYEMDEQCSELYDMERRNCREKIQAKNIAEIFSHESNAKVLVFGGHAHIEKNTRDDWVFMRVVLQDLFPEKKMLSVGQNNYISTNLDEADLDNKNPIVYDNDNGKYDAHLISPHYPSYYSWYYEKSDLMNKRIKLDMTKDFKTVEIIPIVDGKERYFPIFRSTKANLLNDRIYLPRKIDFKIIYKDDKNKRI